MKAATHVAELLVDFASLDVHLHVWHADPLVQVLAVVDFTDCGLGVAGRQDLQHVWRDMVLGLRLLIGLFVQTLYQFTYMDKTFLVTCLIRVFK